VGQGQALALGNSAAGAQMLMQLEAAMRMAWKASSSGSQKKRLPLSLTFVKPISALSNS
jgi:hypothetical protein